MSSYHPFPDFINSCHRKIKYHPLANYLPWWWFEKYKNAVLGVLCSDA
jgi:hypothetical protein